MVVVVAGAGAGAVAVAVAVAVAGAAARLTVTTVMLSTVLRDSTAANQLLVVMLRCILDNTDGKSATTLSEHRASSSVALGAAKSLASVVARSEINKQL